jgi:hypothetical protein
VNGRAKEDFEMSETKGVWVGEHYYFNPPSDDGVDLQTIIARGIAASMGGAAKPGVCAEAETAAAEFVEAFRADADALRDAELKLVHVGQLAGLVGEGGQEKIACHSVAELLRRALDGSDPSSAALEVIEQAKQPY